MSEKCKNPPRKYYTVPFIQQNCKEITINKIKIKIIHGTNSQRHEP